MPRPRESLLFVNSTRSNLFVIYVDNERKMFSITPLGANGKGDYFNSSDHVCLAIANSLEEAEDFVEDRYGNYKRFTHVHGGGEAPPPFYAKGKAITLSPLGIIEGFRDHLLTIDAAVHGIETLIDEAVKKRAE